MVMSAPIRIPHSEYRFYTDPSKGRNEVRIAYVLNKEDLRRALVVLGKALEAYPGATTR